MYGTITNYIGTAYTGQGLHHQYKEIVQQANQTMLLKEVLLEGISKT